jgi:hypothetical protein
MMTPGRNRHNNTGKFAGGVFFHTLTSLFPLASEQVVLYHAKGAVRCVVLRSELAGKIMFDVCGKRENQLPAEESVRGLVEFVE